METQLPELGTEISATEPEKSVVLWSYSHVSQSLHSCSKILLEKLAPEFQPHTLGDSGLNIELGFAYFASEVVLSDVFSPLLGYNIEVLVFKFEN